MYDSVMRQRNAIIAEVVREKPELIFSLWMHWMRPSTSRIVSILVKCRGYLGVLRAGADIEGGFYWEVARHKSMVILSLRME